MAARVGTVPDRFPVVAGIRRVVKNVPSLGISFPAVLEISHQELKQRQAEAGLGKIRLQGEGLLVTGFGLLKAAKVIQRFPEIVVRLGMVGVLVNEIPKHRDGFVQPS